MVSFKDVRCLRQCVQACYAYAFYASVVGVTVNCVVVTLAWVRRGSEVLGQIGFSQGLRWQQRLLPLRCLIQVDSAAAG